MSPIVLSYGYTQNRDCPSPDASLRIINPNNFSKNFPVPAIVDSGAVMTCIPEKIINKLEIFVYDYIDVIGINNQATARKTYKISIQLENELFPDLEVIATPKNYALIGRDILNGKKVTFDAPQEIWIYDCQGSCSLDDGENES